MRPLRITSYLVGLCLTACSPAIEDGSSTGAGQEGSVPLLKAEKAHRIAGSVSLDQGRRWQANPETTAGIRTMRRMLEGYPSNGIAAAALKDTLEAEFALIFERCTMTGEAHEQLHNYLLPLHAMLRELPADAPLETRDSMLAHLQAYGDYFE